MKQNELFAYVYDFISQLMDNGDIFNGVKKIILFGSVARGDFSQESDIDLFIDLISLKKQNEINLLVKKELNRFEIKSEKTWFLRKINLPLKVIVDDLAQEKWKDLREEILSYGQLLYGRFEQIPEKLEPQLLISYHLKKLPQKTKMSFLRKLSGYSTKKNRKTYVQKGLLGEIKSEKISQGVIIPVDDLPKVKSLLKLHKVNYQLKEIWSR